VGRHNPRSTGHRLLTLSEVASDSGPVTGSLHVLPVPRGHDHVARLCVPCIERRHRELTPRPHRGPSRELIAHSIRRHDGNVWPAVVAFGISYRKALRIRRETAA